MKISSVGKSILCYFGIYGVTKRAFYKVTGVKPKPKPKPKPKSRQRSKVTRLNGVTGLPYRLLTKASMNLFSRDDVSSVLYFSDDVDKMYQLHQWLPVIEELCKTVQVTILLRSYKLYELFINRGYSLDIRYIHTIDDLISFYDSKNVKSILYVNNGFKNFQSLMYNKSYHIHINHGESEKSCMHSNQAKAYDFVFTAGMAGTDRYLNNLINCPSEKFVEIGRPQLEYIVQSDVELDESRIKVMYAPTWAATHDSMNYSSVATYGETIVQKILENESLQLIYKPHPSIGKSCRKEKAAHSRILGLIREHEFAFYNENESTDSLFSLVDIAIFDNTSVAIDYLYFDKPFLVTDFFNSSVPRFVEGGYLLKDKDYECIDSVLLGQLSDSGKSHERQLIANYYLSNIGTSTAVMSDKLIELNQEIDQYRYNHLSQHTI